MTTSKKNFLISGAFLAAFALLAVLLKCVDVAPICPDGVSNVGFSHINQAFHNAAAPLNKIGKTVSSIGGKLAALAVLGYACMGFVQLVKRKSLRAVDGRLYLLAGVVVIALAANFFFEHGVIINCRPIFESDGTLEASCPSSHTLFALVLLGASWVLCQQLLREIGKASWLRVSGIVHWAVIALTVAGRLVAGVHWLTDILGGILLGTAILMAFMACSPHATPEGK